MAILTISGSARVDSKNAALLDAFPQFFSSLLFERHKTIHQLPLFQVGLDMAPWPPAVLQWRQKLTTADAVIICTPAYLHNMPALLKNAFEWVTTSGELANKPVLALTFTPHPPRGEKAMQSLLWTLQALNARVVGSLALYQQDIQLKEGKLYTDDETRELLEEAVKLLGGKNEK